ncbi:PREDICTED: separin [Dipodomys ordii]|uniref:separase n=1 Tax=Dipodomys ordii TaxID=10020 RepID=A0A1S3GI27_DIPOR|nr:PREDICTED: separin [Dipodomys ordii]
MLRLAQPLHACLVQCSHQAASQDYVTMTRGSFCLLWKGAEALLDRQAAFSARMKAVSFLVLLEDESTPCEIPHFASPTACRVVAAHQLFDNSGHGLDEADANFLYDLLSRLVIRVLVKEENKSPGPLSPQRALCLLELTLEYCRRLCWSCHFDKANRAVEEAHGYLRNTSLAPSLQLCQLGIELLQTGEEGSQAVAQLLTKASAILNNSMEAPSCHLRALYDSCQFFLSGLERSNKRHHRPDAVLSLFAFLGGYTSLLKQLQDADTDDSEDSVKRQQYLLQTYFQSLHLYAGIVYDFAQGNQVAGLAELVQLVESCKSIVVWMLEALKGLTGQELTTYLGMTASYTSNLAYSFYSHKLYAEACIISEPLCQYLCLTKPETYPEVPSEKLHRFFRLYVESLKKQGQQTQGCKIVTLWLTILKSCRPEHMTEPVTFWVRIKMDAARTGNKELQLKTLRDTLSDWDPETLAFLLREELQAYKAVKADTGQERFNVICDLLELSSEETSAGAWARATHLVELAQVLCYHDFAQQADCSALDAIQEALQLLESVQPEAQAQDQLLDDKAQALLWFYICTLEAKMREGIERDQRAQAPSNLEEFEVNDLNYEDKLQEDRFLYSNIAFNLAADAAQSRFLDQALALWKKVLTKEPSLAVRSLQQTTVSLQILVALYQLVAKPLQALEALLLLRIVAERLEDHTKATSYSCHLTKLLLSLGCPSYAQLYLEEAKSSLKLVSHTADLYPLLSLTCDLLQSHLCWMHQELMPIILGVTVCVLALATLQPGTVGNTLLLTRLEKDNPPVTVQIPTAQNKFSLSSVLREFDAIQKEQKENSCCTDKRTWWTGRLALDRRMEDLITSLEKHVLGCWRGLLLPSSEGPGLATEASRLQELLQECGWEYPDPTLLKVMLSGASTLTSQDIQALSYGLCPAQPERAQELLNEAIRRIQGQIAPSNGHLVLVLDKDLQKLPWESMSILRTLPVTRLPSFHFLLSYSITKEAGASSVLSQGVDPRSTFYVLNPHNNLSSTEQQFRAHFSSEEGWKGVVGEVPSPEQVQAALTEHDLYIYAGHGAGARFLDGQAVLRLSCRAVALLFGCSSAALAVHGNLEGIGIVLKYIMAGCPLFLGNLWDVTDRDIDRYTEALLQGWLGAGPGAPLLYYVNQARQAPRLKFLIGAAPIAYGLPVFLR